MNSFNEIHTLALFCLILSAKFAENGTKASQLVRSFKEKNLTSDFLGDEFFILKCLNYNLNVPTLHDYITQLQMKGIVFNSENITKKKIHVLYEAINKTIFSLVENKILFEIPLDILSYGVVGFCRKLIGLDSLSHEFLVYHLCDDSKINELNECVNKVERCFRVRKVHNNCCSTGKSVQKELTAPNTPNTSDSDTFEETNVGGKCKEHSIIINNSCCSCLSSGNASSNVFVL